MQGFLAIPRRRAIDGLDLPIWELPAKAEPTLMIGEPGLAGIGQGYPRGTPVEEATDKARLSTALQGRALLGRRESGAQDR
jgi:hypothetical protein